MTEVDAEQVEAILKDAQIRPEEQPKYIPYVGYSETHSIRVWRKNTGEWWWRLVGQEDPDKQFPTYWQGELKSIDELKRILERGEFWVRQEKPGG